MHKTIGAAILGMAGLSIGPAAQAAEPVIFTGFAHGAQVVTFDLSPNSPYDLVPVWAGGFTTQYRGTSFVSYCVDLFELLPAFGAANTSYGMVSPAAYFGARTADVARLFGGFAARVDTSLEQAAFQLALWEIRHETTATYRLDAGAARFWDTRAADGNAVRLAQTWLDGLAAQDGRVDLHVLRSAGRQDVVWATPIPEPATAGLMLAGLGALIGAVRWRRSGPSR